MLLYHGVPEKMVGTDLYPLNSLRDIYPNIFDNYMGKYVGREDVPNQIIPVFNCLWNDVLFFIPIPPSDINSAREKYGLPPIERDWFIIDSQNLDQENILLYRHRPPWAIDLENEKEEYVRFKDLSKAQEEEVIKVPDCALWSMRKFGRSSMLFGYMPHVLFRGTIDTKGLTTIRS